MEGNLHGKTKETQTNKQSINFPPYEIVGIHVLQLFRYGKVNLVLRFRTKSTAVRPIARIPVLALGVFEIAAEGKGKGKMDADA